MIGQVRFHHALKLGPLGRGKGADAGDDVPPRQREHRAPRTNARALKRFPHGRHQGSGGGARLPVKALRQPLLGEPHYPRPAPAAAEHLRHFD